MGMFKAAHASQILKLCWCMVKVGQLGGGGIRTWEKHWRPCAALPWCPWDGWCVDGACSVEILLSICAPGGVLIHPMCVCVWEMGGGQHPSLPAHYTKCQTNTPLTHRWASLHTLLVTHINTVRHRTRKLQVLTSAGFYCCTCGYVINFQPLPLLM